LIMCKKPKSEKRAPLLRAIELTTFSSPRVTSTSVTASSIDFRRGVTYGLGVLHTSAQFRLQRWGLADYPIFSGADRDPVASHIARAA